MSRSPKVEQEEATDMASRLATQPQPRAHQRNLEQLEQVRRRHGLLVLNVFQSKPAFAADHPKTTRQSTRYHGGDFAPNPGLSEAWRAWKKGCMAPSSCLHEPACMRCCVWDVAHNTNTVHRKGKVRFLGRGPEYPGSDRITSRVEVSCCLRRTWHQPAINSEQVVSPSLVRCTGTRLGKLFEDITAIKPTQEANPGV